MPFIRPWIMAIILILVAIILILAAVWFWRRKQRRQQMAVIPTPSQRVMVRCSSCKTLNDEDATFCYNCGSKLK